MDSFFLHILGKVSTHSRLKAAGFHVVTSTFPKEGFNTQPPEGGWVRVRTTRHSGGVSTHSRLKAAGPDRAFGFSAHIVSTHSRLKAAGS